MQAMSFTVFGMAHVVPLHIISDALRSFSPSREDLRDRFYCRLEPSHRLAFREFRNFGLVLPFGALNAHFNFPNRFLFSPSGKWLQTDHADPLGSWEYVVPFHYQ
jgi:hypothetical protein